jgi:hypothetical protein
MDGGVGEDVQEGGAHGCCGGVGACYSTYNGEGLERAEEEGRGVRIRRGKGAYIWRRDSDRASL